MAKSGGERFLNWDDFNRACIERGMPPEIFATLKRAYRTFCQGGTDLTTLRWFFTRWASWAKVIPVGADKTLDSTQTGHGHGNRTSPLILYPSKLLTLGFCCEKKPDILWAFGDRGQGKSVASYGMAEIWLQKAINWDLTREYGSPRIYVYGDVNGYVPAEPGWFRCPDWYSASRQDADFPLLEVYDEVPLALRSGAVSKEQKKWAEKLTRSRHYNVWTIMNMVQAKMTAKRGRDMDALTLDRFSGLRQLRERIEDMPLPAFKDVYRAVIPEMRRMDPGLAMTQLNEDQGEPGTWLTFYETIPPSWFEWREDLKKSRSLEVTGAPWPPEAILLRSNILATPIIESIEKSFDDDEAMQGFYDMIGVIPTTENMESVAERLNRQIMRGAGMQWAAIAEALYGPGGAKKERMGGGGPLQRWGHRNKLQDCSAAVKELGTILGSEIPTRNKKPVLWEFNDDLIG